jgi:TctA family transporter
MAGVLIGVVVGVLPGIGGPTALAMILPAVIPLAPVDGIVLLTAVAAVTTCAGDITSILLGVPGEATAAAIIADGQALARRGEAHRAVGAAMAASVMGAVIGVLVLVASIPVALPLITRIQSPELTMLAVLAIWLLVPLARERPMLGVAAGCFGLALASIGLDPSLGIPRLTFGQIALWDGLGLVAVAMGLYAVPEALGTIRQSRAGATGARPAGAALVDGARDALRHARLVGQCGMIGAIVGVVPGVGASVAQWIAYAHAARRPAAGSAVGSGAIEGVLGPASATTATLGGALVPTLALGIPGSVTTTFLLGALVFKGLTPGQAMLTPEGQGGHLTLTFALVWCIVLASAIGAAIAISALGWIASLATSAPSRLLPIVLTLVLIGTIGERRSQADLLILVVLGTLGYAMAMLDVPRAPLVLGFVLGPLLERRLLLSNTVYGWAWVLRPGVLLLAATAVALFFLSRRVGSHSSPRASRTATSGQGAIAGVLIVCGAAGTLATMSLPAIPALFPRIAFGLTLTCGVVQAVVARRSKQDGQPSQTTDRRHLVRLAWFLLFAANAWGLGLIFGTILSAALFLRFEARESIKATVAITAALGVAARLIVVDLMKLDAGGFF